MKAIVYRWFASAAFSLCVCSVAAQSGDLTVRVTNVRSEKGKVLIATDKGQYDMADAKSPEVVLTLKGVPEGKRQLYVYHDENGNYQLDKENGVPAELCAMVDLEVKADTKTVDVRLVDVWEEKKK